MTYNYHCECGASIPYEVERSTPGQHDGHISGFDTCPGCKRKQNFGSIYVEAMHLLGEIEDRQPTQPEPADPLNLDKPDIKRPL